MASGPILPTEQSKKRSSPSTAAKKASVANDASEDVPVAKKNVGVKAAGGPPPPALPPKFGSGPILPQEQGVVSIGTESADEPTPPVPQAAASKAKGKAIAASDNAAQPQIRFTVVLKVRLAKDVKLALSVVSPDGRMAGRLESAELEVYAAKTKPGAPALFREKFPIRKGGLKILRESTPIQFPKEIQDKLNEIVKNKTSANVTAVYVAPPANKVTVSLVDTSEI